jgi:predicted dehydrogenase
MNLRLCMVGCGSFARLCHGPAQRRYATSRTDTELAACCDPDANRAREFGEFFGYARHYSDPKVMLTAEKPDAVILAVPPPVTCAAALTILERGVPLLLEKPPGLDPSELDRLITVAERGRAKTQVAFNRRYMPVVRESLAILNAGFRPETVGRIDYDMVRFNRWDSDFSTTAIHAVDTAFFLARSAVRSAQLHFQPQRAGNRSAMNVLLEAGCASGTRVMVNIQPVAGRNTESIRIHAIDRSVELKVPASPLSSEPGTCEYWRGGERVHTFSDHPSDMIERMGILGELAAFLDAVRADYCPTPGLADCRQQIRLMDAMRRNKSGLIRFEPE